MREIRYRACHKMKGGMRPVSKIDFLEEKVYVLDNKGEELKTPWPFCDVWLVEYTGLKDKNGKEIYEGDVVSQCGVVKWDAQFASFTFGDMHLEKNDDLFIQDSCEAIGNIYENPELLEDKDE